MDSNNRLSKLKNGNIRRPQVHKATTDDEIRSMREMTPKYEKGVVRATSEQGDLLFCTIERHADNLNVPAKSENAEYYNLFGNEDKVGPEDLTIGETLIETDIDLSHANYEVNNFIGKPVTVMMVRGRPQRAMFLWTIASPRNIKSQDIRDARALAKKYGGKEKGLKSEFVQRYLESKGYEKESIEAVVSENWKDNKNALGSTIVYGGTSTWGRKTPNKGGYDMSDSAKKGIVTKIPKTNEETVYCYKPSKVLTAR